MDSLVSSSTLGSPPRARPTKVLNPAALLKEHSAARPKHQPSARDEQQRPQNRGNWLDE